MDKVRKKSIIKLLLRRVIGLRIASLIKVGPQGDMLRELAVKLGANSKDLNDAVIRLAAPSYIIVEWRGGGKALMYVKGFSGGSAG